MKNSSKVIRGGEGMAAGREAQASDRFLPLAELWQTDGPAEGMARPDQAVDLKSRQDEIIEQARQEAEEIRRQARDEGYAKGEQEGRQAGQKQYEQTLRRLETVLAALEREIGARNQRHEEELLLLVKTMTDRLVHHEVSVNASVIRACLREALQYAAENSRIKVHLHADDFERLREASLEDPSLLEGKNRLQLVEDPAVAAGGCFLETDFGEVDATLDNCREKLYAELDRLFLARLGEEVKSERE